jgi:hypothetical protein
MDQNPKKVQGSGFKVQGSRFKGQRSKLTTSFNHESVLLFNLEPMNPKPGTSLLLFNLEP